MDGHDAFGISKGWGADVGRATKNAELKAKLVARKTARAETKARHAAHPKMKVWDAEEDFARRSSRKSVNFVERFQHPGLQGQRTKAKPGLKTSPPRQRSLTPNDKAYLGLPGAPKGIRQGTYSPDSPTIPYELTGNKRVRKALKPEHLKAMRSVQGQSSRAGGWSDARLRSYEGEPGNWKPVARGIAGAPRTPGQKKKALKALREINQPYRQLKLF